MHWRFCVLAVARVCNFLGPPVQTAIHTTAALKGGTAALKGQMKMVSLDEIEDNLDDMAELLEESNEIQEVRVLLFVKCHGVLICTQF